MKKVLFVAAILLAATASQAQKAVVFKMKYLPNHYYKTVMTLGVDMTMAQAAAKSKTKNTTAAKPMVTKTNMKMALDIKTGPAKASQSFPLTFEYTNVDVNVLMNGKPMNMPKNPMIGQKVIAECDANGQLHIDSVQGGGQQEMMKKAMIETINKLQSQVKFPDKALAVGESFTQDVPFAMPSAGINMKMNVRTVYRLKSIVKNQAYFDFTQSMNINFDGDKSGGVKVTGTAAGPGKMIYDISQNFPVSLNSLLNMNYTTKSGANTIQSNLKMTTDMNTEISAN